MYDTTSAQSETFCVAANDDTHDNDNYIYYTSNLERLSVKIPFMHLSFQALYKVTHM